MKTFLGAFSAFLIFLFLFSLSQEWTLCFYLFWNQSLHRLSTYKADFLAISIISIAMLISEKSNFLHWINHSVHSGLFKVVNKWDIPFSEIIENVKSCFFSSEFRIEIMTFCVNTLYMTYEGFSISNFWLSILRFVFKISSFDPTLVLKVLHITKFLFCLLLQVFVFFSVRCSDCLNGSMNSVQCSTLYQMTAVEVYTHQYSVIVFRRSLVLV